MKYSVSMLLLIIGFGFINKFEPLDWMDIVGLLIIIVGFGLGRD